MKQKSIIPKKCLANFIALFTTLLFTLAFFTACNDKKKDDEGAVKEATKIENTAEQLTAKGYAVVKLNNADLKALFANQPGGPAQKLNIQFRDENIANDPMLAVAFGCKQNGITVTGPKNMNQDSTQLFTTTGTAILGNNELSEGKIKALIKMEIRDYSGDLYFYPKKDTVTNHIYYVVWTSRVEFKKGKEFVYPAGEDTNPSPPKPPCTTCN